MTRIAVQDGMAEYGARQIAPLLQFTEQAEIADYLVIAFKHGERFEVATSLTSSRELVHRLRVVADLLEMEQ